MSIASEIDRINGEVSSQSTIIDEISTILDGKTGIDLNSIDYSSNIYETTYVSYYNKNGTEIKKEVGNVGGFIVSDVDFTKNITFGTGGSNNLVIKVVGNVMVADVFGGEGVVTS